MGKLLKRGKTILLFLLALVFILAGGLIGKKYDDAEVDQTGNIRLYHQARVSYLSENKVMNLPNSIKNLPARTKVTVTFDVKGSPGDELYIKSVYAPVKVYVNNHLIYDYGQKGTRPSFMKDPACVVDTMGLPFHKDHQALHIRAVYYSLYSRPNLSLKAWGVGTDTQITKYVSSHYSFTRGISIMFLILGIFLIFFAIFFLKNSAPIKRFFHAGVLILCAGVWLYCVNDLTIFIDGHYNLYYLLGFPCMFLMMCPLTKFVSVQLGERGGKTISFVYIFNVVSCFTAFILQLTGIVDYHGSFYFFMIMESICLVIVVSVMGYHVRINRRKDDQAFFLATLNLTIFMGLALIRRFSGHTSDLVFVPLGFFIH